MTAEAREPQDPNPVPPGVEYHRVLAGEERRIGRRILATDLLIGGMFVALYASSYLGGWILGLIRPGATSDAAPLLTAVTLAQGIIAAAMLIVSRVDLMRLAAGRRLVDPARRRHTAPTTGRFHDPCPPTSP